MYVECRKCFTIDELECVSRAKRWIFPNFLSLAHVIYYVRNVQTENACCECGWVCVCVYDNLPEMNLFFSRMNYPRNFKFSLLLKLVFRIMWVWIIWNLEYTHTHTRYRAKKKRATKFAPMVMSWYCNCKYVVNAHFIRIPGGEGKKRKHYGIRPI